MRNWRKLYKNVYICLSFFFVYFCFSYIGTEHEKGNKKTRMRNNINYNNKNKGINQVLSDKRSMIPKWFLCWSFKPIVTLRLNCFKSLFSSFLVKNEIHAIYFIWFIFRFSLENVSLYYYFFFFWGSPTKMDNRIEANEIFSIRSIPTIANRFNTLLIVNCVCVGKFIYCENLGNKIIWNKNNKLNIS